MAPVVFVSTHICKYIYILYRTHQKQGHNLQTGEDKWMVACNGDGGSNQYTAYKNIVLISLYSGWNYYVFDFLLLQLGNLPHIL